MNPTGVPPTNLMSPIDPVVLTGLVSAVDPDRFPQAIVESLTEFDYAQLPDDLRDRLRDWCEDFRRWSLGMVDR